MVKKIDRNSPIPIYKQIANLIEIDIRNKKYDENFKLPTENEFTKIYNVSRMTIRQALKLLEDKDLISREAGKGTFLKDNRLNNPMEGSHSFSKLIETQGLKAGAKLISASLERPTTEDLKELDLKEDEHIVVIKRVRYANGEPISYEISRFTENYKFLLTKDLNDNSLYDILYKEKNIYFTKTKRTIELVRANDTLSDYLQVEKDYPIILIRGVATDNYNNISHRAFEYLLGDKFKFTI
ncbi:GntR family transcriptional regulator [Tepidimicrobium xylanilyticum]|uniref:GntR family transcriptional regulator n=1 Tax=Tepidimicrobium xylanilyticum TaxID=1123352 RepID=A0A1H2WFC5_9FIRM|nr:GntR family transcriptional regulator [Tepidimicrobium xylanilyticum]GMG95256.1 GntR family transcriptional regulator [Tepidimicrobium xylanilyticum]SDW79218.1 GntR family transcriptional regulator [Tepidimicrobium xylanilyticum]